MQVGELLIFAMEYVEGEDLDKVVKRQGPLPVAHACHYVSHAALGLQHAHEQGMVHRDIKPPNLILTRRGKKHVVKVLDFGLAKAVREGEAATDLTGAGAMMGTPAYMAPEQAQDAASADIRADIYSLGCTLYFLLTGAPPFAGASIYAILKAHESTEAASLHQKRPGVPAELSAIAAQMMAKDPARRFQKPIDAAKALAPFIKAGPPLAKIMTVELPTPDKGGHQPSPVPPAGARPLLLDCTGEQGVSAADVRKSQEAWAKCLGRQVEEEDEIAPGVKMKFVLIPPDKYLMGSPEGETDRSKDEEQHEVEITKPFYLAVYDVTQAQYAAVTGKTPSEFKGADLPVEQVSWEDADAFAKGLTEKARDGLLYCLPHEVEWEYACRGGRPSSLAFGVGDGTTLSTARREYLGFRPSQDDAGGYLQAERFGPVRHAGQRVAVVFGLVRRLPARTCG